MRLLRILFGIFLIASLGWTVPQSEETIGNLKFKLPTGWTKSVYRNEVALKPGDVHPSEWCTVTIKSGLRANGDLVQWVNQQADEFLRGRQVLMNTPLPYQDDPKGWEGCGLAFAVRVNANTPTYYHTYIGFRRGDVAGTMHFVTDKLEYNQKYQKPVGDISGSLAPVNGFGASSNTGNPPPTNPTGGLSNPTGPPSNPVGPPNLGGAPGNASGPSAVSSPKLYFPDSLPPPAAIPEGSVEAAATTLAKRILEGGPDGLAALERAVLMCGFSIHEMPGQASIATAQTPNGMSFADIDLIGANALLEWGASYDLGSLETAFRGVKKFHKVDFVPLWKKSVNAAQTSSKPNDKFFGTLLRALGKESQGRFSDFTATDAASKLCPAQLYLLVWRSVGHVIAAKKEQVSELPHGPSIRDQGSQSDAVNNLTTLVDSFANVDWTNVLGELVSHSYSLGIHDYLLAIARLQILLSETQWQVFGLDEPRPLVRSKKTGETGEDRQLLVGVRWVPKKANWQKFNAAAKALGYSLSEVHSEGTCDVRYSGPGNDTIQPIPGQSVAKFAGSGGFTNYAIPIQGSPQKRKLSSNPEEERKKANADVVIRFIPGTGSGKVIQAEQDILEQVAVESIWLPVSKTIGVEVPVKDWKSSGWQGTLIVEVTGSGNWQRGRSSGHWKVDRTYWMEVNFEKLAQNMLVTRRPVPPGGHSLLPPSPIEGNVKINDLNYYQGPIKDCLGGVVGSGKITTTWKSQPPENRREEVDLQQTPILEFDPSRKTYSILFMNGSPYVPVVKRAVTIINGKTTTSNNRMRQAFLDGVSIVQQDHTKGRVILDQKMPERNKLSDVVGPTYLDGFKGPEQFMAGDVKVILSWDIGEGQGDESVLEKIANRGLISLVMQDMARSALGQVLPLEQEEPFGEDPEDMATCLETKARVQGQLRHATGRSRQARYRSSR